MTTITMSTNTSNQSSNNNSDQQGSEHPSSNTSITQSRLSFSSFKSSPNITRDLFCSWKSFKGHFLLWIFTCLHIMECLHKFGIALIENSILHVFNQALSLAILYVFSIRILRNDVYYEDNSITIAVLVCLIFYVAIQNIMFCILKKSRTLESRWKELKEAFQALCIIYVFIGIIYDIILIVFGLDCLKDNIYIGSIVITIFALQLVIDGHVIELMCPILLLLFSIFVIVFFIIFSIINGFLFITIRKCKIITQKELLEKLQENIQTILEKVSWIYHNEKSATEPESSMCTICLENMEGMKVVSLDCSEVHIFHKSCMNEWLCKENNCPLCRSIVIPEELYNL